MKKKIIVIMMCVVPFASFAAGKGIQTQEDLQSMKEYNSKHMAEYLAYADKETYNNSIAPSVTTTSALGSVPTPGMNELQDPIRVIKFWNKTPAEIQAMGGYNQKIDPASLRPR